MNDNQFDIAMTMNTLDDLLKATDLNDVTSESSGFDDLPAGYYLSEVNSAELTISKNSGNPQVKVVFKALFIPFPNADILLLKILLPVSKVFP